MEFGDAAIDYKIALALTLYGTRQMTLFLLLKLRGGPMPLVKIETRRWMTPEVKRSVNVSDDDHSLHGTFAALDWDALLHIRAEAQDKKAP